MTNEPQQITDIKSLAGKTIERAVWLRKYESAPPCIIGLIFDDGTFAHFVIEQEPYGEEKWISIEYLPESDQERLAFGLIDQAEIDRRNAEREARENASREAHERRQYERLRQKFEGKP